MTSDAVNIVHVVAGVLRDPQNRILLAERPPGKHLSGLWEFPGGKCEPGELPEVALKRELLEEIGVIADQLTPLIRIPWIYPTKRIVLAVYCVDAYHGEPYGREGQNLRWQTLADLNIADMPAADRPVIHALKLPPHYVITPEPVSNDESFLASVERVLARGERLLQLRDKALPRDQLRALASQVSKLCLSAGTELLINADIELAQELHLSGVHLTSAQLRSLKQRPLPANQWVAASCHNQEELELAHALDVDFITLSPVNPTPSHPQLPALGWDAFSQLCDLARVPVYALGGVNKIDWQQARNHGAQGVAGIRSFW